jgi:glycosyltransferase involved in cell wall biosynthesis
MTRCSIIIPSYGRPEFLRAAVGSALAQTVIDIEVIVVDDASPEPIELDLDDRRVKVIRHERNRGPAAARNSGLDAAAGDIVSFLDDDDLYTPVRVESALRALRDAPVSVCAHQRMGSSEVVPSWVSGDVGDSILDRSPPNLGSVAVRRAECPRFDEQFRAAEDLDWWLRVAATMRVAAEPEVGWIWRRHDGPRPTVGAETRLQSNLMLLDRHAEYFASHRRAAAFRWVRIAWLHRRLHDTAAARRAAITAVRSDPTPRTMARACRVVVGR